ncbi:MAG: hypothetical protein Q9221_000347 [Calogaya cf. arnoldii]
MDGVSSAASILAIAAAGLQISFRLITFANQVSTGAERIRYIGTDVSLTAGVLQQLGDLMKKTPGEDEHISIFSENGLTSTQAAAAACQSVFEALEVALRKASQQIRRRPLKPGEKIVLSKAESLRWPFLQPNFDAMGRDLSSSRATLMLILQVTTLAYQKKLAELQRAPSMSREEQEALIRSIIAMQREQPPGEPSHSEPKTERSQEYLLLPIAYDPPEPFASFASPPPFPEVEPRLGRMPAPDSQSRKVPPNLRGVSSTEREISIGDPVQDSAPAIGAGKDLQVWIIVPIVKAIYCGYQMMWLTEQLPLPGDEAQQELHTLTQKDKRTLTEQLGSLTWKEREFLNAFVTGELPEGSLYRANMRNGAVRIKVLGVIAEGMQPSRDRFEEVKNRDIKVFVRTNPYLILIQRLSEKRINELASTQRRIDERASSGEPRPSCITFSGKILQKAHHWISKSKRKPPLARAQMPSPRLQPSGRSYRQTTEMVPLYIFARNGGRVPSVTESRDAPVIARVSNYMAACPSSAEEYHAADASLEPSLGTPTSHRPHRACYVNQPTISARAGNGREPANDEAYGRQAIAGNSTLDEPTSFVPESSITYPPPLAYGPSLSRKRKEHGLFPKQPTQEPANNQVHGIQDITKTSGVDEPTLSDRESFNEELNTTKQEDEGMKIVEEYLARYTTLYDGS